MNKKLSLFLYLLPFLMFLFFYYALIEKRQETQVYSAKLNELRRENYELRDTNRNLRLEHEALFDHDKMRVLANDLGMSEPSLADESLLYVEEQT